MQGAPPALFGLRLSLVDAYLIGEMLAPMLAALAVILVALLLYRILDIFNYMAGSSARFGVIPRMIVDVAPQYLALALPGAYFISMFLVVARLSEASEIDALLASGLSIGRLVRPMAVVGAAVAVLNLALLGFAQPYGHYDFYADLEAAIHAPWDARVQPRTFIGAGSGLTLSAEHADPAGRALSGVFARRMAADGSEEIFTAEHGAVQPIGEDGRFRVVLLDGEQLAERPGAAPVVGRFSRLAVEMGGAAPAGFRGRGLNARELTLAELPRRMREGTPAERAKAASEFNARLVRTLSIPLLPLVAAPAGIASKRRRRALGATVCVILLFLYENAIDFGQSLADGGHAPAGAVWVPFVLFAVGAATLFRLSRTRPGETPFTALQDSIEPWLAGLVRRAAPRPAARVTPR